MTSASHTHKWAILLSRLTYQIKQIIPYLYGKYLILIIYMVYVCVRV